MKKLNSVEIDVLVNEIIENVEKLKLSKVKDILKGKNPDAVMFYIDHANDIFTFEYQKGKEPNWFVRWMMKICFACTWVKEPK